MQTCRTVTLRERLLKNGMKSYYLDYHPYYNDPVSHKRIKHETLNIYTYTSPKNSREKGFNNRMREKAEIIRCRRYEQIINQRYSLYDSQLSKESFLTYFKEKTLKHNRKVLYSYKSFSEFTKGACTFGELDLDLCNAFYTYINSLKSKRQATQPLSRNTKAAYWSGFRLILNEAHKERRLTENINALLNNIKTEESHRERLSMLEVIKLKDAYCTNETLKRASLFSCLTGLRFSDISGLKWGNVKKYPGEGGYIDHICKKTGKHSILPICDDAMDLLLQCGNQESRREEPHNSDAKIFSGLKYHHTREPLRKWVESAGIDKHITFHSFRHTYASLQIELGTDIYTVKQLLAHSNVSTTEIYLRNAVTKKREAAQRITFSVMRGSASREEFKNDTNNADISQK